MPRLKGNPKRQQMRFDVDTELYRMIEACRVIRDEENMALTCRRLLKEAAGREMVENSSDTLSPMLRRIIKEEFRISENRIAKIVAKAANAAATAMYMTYQALLSLGTKDMPAIYEAARKKGVLFVKTPLDESSYEENTG